MSAHAPAPWMMNGDGDAILNARGKRVAELRVDHEADNPVGEFDANARLLIAAPELLAALCDLLAATDHFRGDDDMVLALQRAHAAVNKAKGVGK